MNEVSTNILNKWSVSYVSKEFTHPLLDKHVYDFDF